MKLLTQCPELFNTKFLYFFCTNVRDNPKQPSYYTGYLVDSNYSIHSITIPEILYNSIPPNMKNNIRLGNFYGFWLDLDGNLVNNLNK